MPFVPDWIKAPDVLGAAEAGTRLGLTRAQMLEQADEHAAQIAVERDRIAAESAARGQALHQERENQSAALALRQQALKQAGLFGQGRLDNQTDAMQEKAHHDAANELFQADRGKQIFQDRQNAQHNKDMAWFNQIDKEEKARKAQASKSAADALKSNALTPGIRDQIFKQLLSNSTGGTNVDEAISGLNKYSNPTASDSLQTLQYTQGQDAGGGAIPLPNAEVNQGPTPSAARSAT